MNYEHPPKDFPDWFFQRFIAPFLMVCLLCLAVSFTYMACRWLITPSQSVASFSEYLDGEERAVRTLFTLGTYTIGEADKQIAAVNTARAHVREFLRTR
jgi:glucan phosphoethanolaminetransferase (alkaline phosphatase superfamily)